MKCYNASSQKVGNYENFGTINFNNRDKRCQKEECRMMADC